MDRPIIVRQWGGGRTIVMFFEESTPTISAGPALPAADGVFEATPMEGETITETGTTITINRHNYSGQQIK